MNQVTYWIAIILMAVWYILAHFYLLAQAKKKWKKQAQLYEAIIKEQAKQISILKNWSNEKIINIQASQQVFDNFANQSIKIMSEALAEKDQTIQDLQQKKANCPTCRKEVAHV